MVDEKRKYCKEKEKILKQFGIKVTASISAHIEELYPSDISVENYTRSLILKSLSK